MSEFFLEIIGTTRITGEGSDVLDLDIARDRDGKLFVRRTPGLLYKDDPFHMVMEVNNFKSYAADGPAAYPEDEDDDDEG